MFWNKRTRSEIEDALYDVEETTLLSRYEHFVSMYCLFFNSFVRIFTLHGIMSSVFLGIVAAINADQPQKPFFYLASTSFYAMISAIIVLTMLRLQNLISIYSEELHTIETRIRIVQRKQRKGLRTSNLITLLIILISVTISLYLIAPARDDYAFLRPFSDILSVFDIPIDLSGLNWG